MPAKQRVPRGLQVRWLESGDVGLAFHAIRTLKNPPPSFDDDYLRKFLARPENILIVAADESIPVGFLLAYLLDRVDRNQRMVSLYEVEVCEPFRRRGIGRAMIETLKTICKQENAMKVWVITNRSNRAAFRLYESTGAIVNASGDEVTLVYGSQN